jgi:O-acetyl-ADP-ribose deacetylase (regulator of RNase III)
VEANKAKPSSSSRAVGEASNSPQASSIAFPAISTGIFGYPFEAATLIAINTIRAFEEPPNDVRLVAFSSDDHRRMSELLATLDGGM